jgi:hypothetical protein
MTNFWQALEQIDQTQPLFELEYRLYYDVETGKPLFYTTQDERGTYILIDKETYHRSDYDIIIKNKKITKEEKLSTGKLIPATTGTATHVKDITIIVNNNSKTLTLWDLKTYE